MRHPPRTLSVRVRAITTKHSSIASPRNTTRLRKRLSSNNESLHLQQEESMSQPKVQSSVARRASGQGCGYKKNKQRRRRDEVCMPGSRRFSPLLPSILAVSFWVQISILSAQFTKELRIHTSNMEDYNRYSKRKSASSNLILHDRYLYEIHFRCSPTQGDMRNIKDA